MAVIAVTTYSPVVTDVPVADVIRRLEASVARMESRYGRSSEAMLREVGERPTRETREVGDWLAEYHLLTLLRG